MLLEIVITIAVIILILVMVGVPLISIVSLLVLILLGGIALAMFLFSLFFLVTDISLLFRKRAKGKFLRITDTDRFEHAVYQVGDAEYTCLFPAESVGRTKLYRTDAEYMLLIPRSPKRKSAYDRHSLFVITVGSVFSVVFSGALIAAAILLPTILE